MHRRVVIVISIVSLVAVLIVAFLPRSAKSPVPGVLSQHVYVWQRSWSPAVKDAVRQRGPNFGEVVTLVAEVTWKNGEGKAAHVKVDSAALLATQRPVGIAIRINPFDGPKTTDPFAPAGPQTKFLCDLAAESIERIKNDSITPAELQIDFDCPESKLELYRNWVVALRQRITPIPLCITTLPSLLSSPHFKALVQQCDSYVLQVHSIKRPVAPDQLPSLCDVEQARGWVQTAAQIGVPFRVALPTYAYVAEFDAKGKCLRLAAEGSNLHPPPGGCVREIQSDAVAVANLVHDWSIDPPANLAGLIWYRLPNEDDDLNWRWSTLAVVMQGRAPDPHETQVSVVPMLENHESPATVPDSSR